jgi:hypothetical protein
MYSSSTSAWIEMYNQYIKAMNEYYTGYLESMKTLNKSFVQTTDRVNEESGKSTENVSSYYISYLEAWQKMAQQWMNAFWGPYLQGAQAQARL